MNYSDYEIPKNLIFETRDIFDLEGLNCSMVLDPEDFKDILTEPCKITKINIKLRFSVAGKDIYVGGTVYGKVRVQCGRCLEMCDESFEEEFTELYPTKCEIIDIMYLTKQTLALLQDIRNICSVNCKGLCGFCGANRNNKQCDCKASDLSPFAVLKEKFSK